jgi:hypothetical protein
LEKILGDHEEIPYVVIEIAVRAYLAALSTKKLAAIIAAADKVLYSDGLDDKSGSQALMLLAEHIVTTALEEVLARGYARDDVKEKFVLNLPH